MAEDNPIRTDRMYLVYRAEDGTLHYQYWGDVAAVGGLVDPETGDDMELIGWTL